MLTSFSEAPETEPEPDAEAAAGTEPEEDEPPQAVSRAKRENGGQGKCCKLLHFHGQKPLSKFSLSGAGRVAGHTGVQGFVSPSPSQPLGVF